MLPLSFRQQSTEGQSTDEPVLPDAPHRPSSRDLPSLDGLRAVSIIFVILGHALQGSGGFAAGLFSRLANLGVCVFFVISGFLITTIISRDAQLTGRVQLSRFYLRRTLRIFPPYYVYLAVIGLGGVIGAWTAPPGTRWWPALTYLSNIFSPGDSRIEHSWSLSLEEQFYLMWPVAFAFCISRRGAVNGLQTAARLAIAGLVASPIIRVLVFVLTRDGSLTALLIFDFVSAGSAIALLQKSNGWQRWYRTNVEGREDTLMPLAILLTVLLHLVFAQSTRVKFAIDTTVITPLEAVLLALFIAWTVRNPKHPIGRLLNFRPLRIIGFGSYSLYLWQQIFLGPWSPFHWPIAVSVVAAFACAAGSFWGVERPCLRLRTMLERTIYSKDGCESVAPEVRPNYV